MIYDERPDVFRSEKAGSICFVECRGEFLLLKRAPDSYEGGLWTAAPGGKLEPGETPLEGALREVEEETGVIFQAKQLRFIGVLYFCFPDMEYALHLFHTKVEKKPEVEIRPNEHTEYRWGTLREARKLPLMRGGQECLRFLEEGGL